MAEGCSPRKKNKYLPKEQSPFFSGLFFVPSKGVAVELRKLEDIFYTENTHLVEVLDKNHLGVWNSGKIRGYGVVICDYNGLRFGIPLRSRVHPKNNFCFKTVGDKGLDFTKAVLLEKDEYISPNPFTIPRAEHTKIIDKAHHITSKFSKYVERYVLAVSRPDANILREYSFSTLQNYHTHLGVAAR